MPPCASRLALSLLLDRTELGGERLEVHAGAERGVGSREHHAPHVVAGVELGDRRRRAAPCSSAEIALRASGRFRVTVATRSSTSTSTSISVSSSRLSGRHDRPPRRRPGTNPSKVTTRLMAPASSSDPKPQPSMATTPRSTRRPGVAEVAVVYLDRAGAPQVDRAPVSPAIGARMPRSALLPSKTASGVT